MIVLAGLAGLAAVAPWKARGENYSDDRYQQRQNAAKILRTTLGRPGPASDPPPAELARCRSAVSRAIELVGPDCHAAAELTLALREADTADPTSESTLTKLREQIREVCDRLAFAPLMEAEMPEGFPPPTPLGEVEVKKYPVYRMAMTRAGESSAFWVLFGHIKRNKVAMTTPVEMNYQNSGNSEPEPRSMAFLYGDRNLAPTGTDGAVSVVDVPAQTVVSAGLRGEREPQKVVAARQKLMKWIEDNSDRYRPAGEMRVLGYNSPFVPSSQKYFEVQIPITDVMTATSGQH
jgi:DNA gyrase inhibitor GyrI